MGIKAITNIKILGQNYYYDEEKELVGFPLWYDKTINSLDYRVGHQYWIPELQAKAIIQRVLEQEWSKNNDE